MDMTDHDNSGLSVISFPGTGNLTHFAATENGYYAEEGLAVELTPTPNSVYQITNTVAGEFDIASTAIDNIVAYQEGQGAVELDSKPDLFVFMGGSQIDLSFVVQPGIESFADLKGKSLAVDALSTGFAFVLYQMLEDGGLGADDYTLASVGGTDKRWDSIKAGEHAGSLMNDPFSGFALAAGFRLLASSAEMLEHYQSGVFAASRAWAAAHRAEIVGFIRANIRAVDWVLDPANRDAAAEMLIRNMPALSADGAAGAVAKLISPRTGYTPKAGLDRAGIETVLALRSRYAEPRKSLADPDRYLDMSYYEEALSSL
jgi:ABC-type nitrate/sulfonate/bicarbonate transport system substrate-binding protein